MPRSLSFITLLLAALALMPGMAHLLEMHNKMELTRENYGAVQYIYNGWALLGFIQFAAVIFTFMLYIRSRRSWLVLTAWICLTLTLVVFLVFTYPVNRITENWTVLPQNWETLRRQWEYSHAANALLELAAFILLLLAVFRRTRRKRL